MYERVDYYVGREYIVHITKGHERGSLRVRGPCCV